MATDPEPKALKAFSLPPAGIEATDSQMQTPVEPPLEADIAAPAVWSAPLK
jgi:hypothetical protein